ncbi:MAG: hypothetical protein RB191_04755 [Terriglobia bacterium]|nr:hypothetical protein [Terriglobia bacterium]
MSFARDVLGLPLPSRRLIRERILARTATANPHPVFVFGNQKSGTTAIAGLLAAATGKSVTLDFAGAEHPHATALLSGVTPIAEFVRHNSWALSSQVIKEPTLTFVAPQLIDHFGVEKAVFIVRNPFDNIRSILVRQKLSGDMETLPKGARLNPTWRRILSGEDLGLPRVHYIEILALRWLRAVEILQSRRELFVLVRYEDFLRNKKSKIAEIAQAFDLEVADDVTPLLEVEYQPRDKISEAPHLFFGSNHRRIENICGSAAASFGYQ